MVYAGGLIGRILTRENIGSEYFTIWGDCIIILFVVKR